MRQSIVFDPEVDERQLDRETSKVDDKLQSVGEDVTVSFDPDELDGLGPAGGGRGGGGVGAGAAAGVASKIPAPISGAISKALPVALAGGVGVGLLSEMSDASARLQTSASILGTAQKNFFREPGNVLDENIVRPLSEDILGLSTDFEDTASGDGGLSVAFGELFASATISVGQGAFDWLKDEIPDVTVSDFLGPVGKIGPGVVTGIINEIKATNFSDFSGLSTELTNNVIGAWPEWPSINAEWPGFPSIKAEWGGWPNVIDQWDGWPSVISTWPGWPSVQAEWGGWPSVREAWSGWPNIIEQWTGWPNVVTQWTGWPDVVQIWQNMGGWPNLRDLWPGWDFFLPNIDPQQFINSVLSGGDGEVEEAQEPTEEQEQMFDGSGGTVGGGSGREIPISGGGGSGGTVGGNGGTVGGNGGTGTSDPLPGATGSEGGETMPADEVDTTPNEDTQGLGGRFEGGQIDLQGLADMVTNMDLSEKLREGIRNDTIDWTVDTISPFWDDYETMLPYARNEDFSPFVDEITKRAEARAAGGHANYTYPVSETVDDLVTAFPSITAGDIPMLNGGGRVQSTGTATVHRGELVTDEARLVRELADAIDSGDGGGGGTVDLSPLESKLDRLHNDLRQLRRAMDVTLEVDKETLGRATSDARDNRMADTDPTV